MNKPDMIKITAAGSTFRCWSTTQKAIVSAYVLIVAVVATVGFFAESTTAILLAALLSLPVSVIALPGYYVAYGLLALAPGANPSESSGARACNAHGVDCDWSRSSDLAEWFHVTTDVIGVLALTCAAILNVLTLRILIGLVHRRASPMP